MKVKEVIAALSKFDGDMEVIISDGYQVLIYKGQWEIKEFEGTVDIGIGGTLMEDE